MNKQINFDLNESKFKEIFKKENWQELFDLTADIAKNYLMME